MIKNTSFIFALLLLLSSFTLTAADEPAYVDGKANYYAIDPPLVVNLNAMSKIIFLQIKVQLMSRDASAMIAVTKNRAAIVDTLTMLLAEQTPETMQDVKIRESVRMEALERCSKVLEKLAGIRAGKPTGEKDSDGNPIVTRGLEAVLFTDIVIQ
ncbi:MAG: flagellar basal body-associated FliL family protein [Gammaproteobacteria bacterium]|nr:flagellar basal body-associated FliL family protein [Gammaproteobacteria bacterium]